MADVKQELPALKRVAECQGERLFAGVRFAMLDDLLALLPLLEPEQVNALLTSIDGTVYQHLARARDAAIKRAEHYEKLWQENHEHKDRAFTERNVARRRVEVLEEELAAAIKRAEEAEQKLAAAIGQVKTEDGKKPDHEMAGRHARFVDTVGGWADLIDGKNLARAYLDSHHLLDYWRNECVRLATGITDLPPDGAVDAAFQAFDDLRAENEKLRQKLDLCRECGGENCSALWRESRKCCPGCTHSKSEEVSLTERLEAVMAENEKLRAELATAIGKHDDLRQQAEYAADEQRFAIVAALDRADCPSLWQRIAENAPRVDPSHALVTDAPSKPAPKYDVAPAVHYACWVGGCPHPADRDGGCCFAHSAPPESRCLCVGIPPERDDRCPEHGVNRPGQALDEWTDEKCDEYLSWRPVPKREGELLVAIKRRNARIRELESELATLRAKESPEAAWTRALTYYAGSIDHGRHPYQPPEK